MPLRLRLRPLVSYRNSFLPSCVSLPLPIPSHTKSHAIFQVHPIPSIVGFLFFFPFFFFFFFLILWVWFFSASFVRQVPNICYLLGGRYLFGQVLSCLHMCMMMYFFWFSLPQSSRQFEGVLPLFSSIIPYFLHTGNIPNLFWVSPPPDHDGGCTVETC